MIVIVMGVAGSGKSTVGGRLAERLGFALAEGDDFHPPSNVAKMSRRVPLEDADRWPWIDRMADAIDGWLADGRDVVLTCSALKRAYRERLIGQRRSVRLVYLRGTKDLIGRRLESRRGHFMPPALLDSQFAALEPPEADERPVVVDVTAPADRLVLTIARALGHLEVAGTDQGEGP